MTKKIKPKKERNWKKITKKKWKQKKINYYIRLYSIIFTHIRYFLQSAGEVRIGVLVKCQNSYVVFLQSSEVKKKKTNKKQKTKLKKITKKTKLKKNKILYLLIFAHIRLYSPIFAHIRYFLQNTGEVGIGVLVKCWNSYIVFLQSSERSKE